MRTSLAELRLDLHAGGAAGVPVLHASARTDRAAARIGAPVAGVAPRRVFAHRTLGFDLQTPRRAPVG